MNILKRGLIGCNAKIIASRNTTLVGVEGIIVDETRNMIKIKTNDGEKEIIKNTVKIQINDAVVDGKDLIGTVDERIKKKVKK